jgi:hypothetical protein
MTEIVEKTLLELLTILALATKLVKQGQPGEFPLAQVYLAQCNADKFVRKLSERKYDTMVLDRLDRLTLEEARITATQILEVVYGLFQNMKVETDGERIHYSRRRWVLRILPTRWQGISRPC